MEGMITKTVRAMAYIKSWHSVECCNEFFSFSYIFDPYTARFFYYVSQGCTDGLGGSFAKLLGAQLWWFHFEKSVCEV